MTLFSFSLSLMVKTHNYLAKWMESPEDLWHLFFIKFPNFYFWIILACFLSLLSRIILFLVCFCLSFDAYSICLSHFTLCRPTWCSKSNFKSLSCWLGWAWYHLVLLKTNQDHQFVLFPCIRNIKKTVIPIGAGFILAILALVPIAWSVCLDFACFGDWHLSLCCFHAGLVW